MEESFPFAAAAVVPENMTRTEVEQVLSGIAKVDQPMSEEMPTPRREPEGIKTGTFRDADDFHKGSGRATIYRLADGTHLLRLEDFRVTNGPALHVLLSIHPDPSTRADLNSQSYVDLGDLKGNIGNQNYEISSDVDVTAQGSVVIYCKPFHVVFSVATLEDAAP